MNSPQILQKRTTTETQVPELQLSFVVVLARILLAGCFLLCPVDVGHCLSFLFV
jgi:hypothetical protein